MPLELSAAIGWDPLVVARVVSTTELEDPVPDGMVQITWVAVQVWTGQLTEPTLMVPAPWAVLVLKYTPLMVSGYPPLVVPVVGEIVVICGSANDHQTHHV